MRDIFWENSSHGINPHNVGMYDREFASADEVVDHILSASIYCVMKEGKYINFPPIPIKEYFASTRVKGEYFNAERGVYEEIFFEPEAGDLEYLRTFKYEDLTFRGTIEYRSCCCQPLSESMTVAAFHKGLNEMTDDIEKLLSEDKVLYGHGYTAAELRHMIIRNEIPAYAGKDALKQVLKDILDIASEGLARKGAREEIFLEPLYERVDAGINPALKMRKMIADKVPMTDIIREYSL
jgi:gamma-glutamylcysteine synthetase